MLIGPPGQLQMALRNRDYLEVRVWEQDELAQVVAEFGCMPGDPDLQWNLENLGKNAGLSLLGCSYLHRSAGGSKVTIVTARFQYAADAKTVQRVPKPRVR